MLVSPADLGSAQVCLPQRQPLLGSALGCSDGLCVCACPVIPWPVLEMGAVCGIAFAPSLAWGSKTRGAGQGAREISSHDAGVGEESLTSTSLITSHSPLLAKEPPKSMQGNGRHVSPYKLPMRAFERVDTPTHLCLARTQLPLPPLSGGLWGSSARGWYPPWPWWRPLARYGPCTLPDVREPDGLPRPSQLSSQP